MIDDCFVNHNYPAVIKNIIIKSMLYTAMMGSLVKIESIITLQLQNDNSLLKLLVSEQYQQKFIRAYCRYDDILNHSLIDFNTLTDGNLLSITIDPVDTQLNRHQGLIKLSHESFDEGMKDFFTSSEQSETKVKTAIRFNDKAIENKYEAACLMIQKLPEGGQNNDLEDPWDRIGIFYETISDDDLFKIAANPKDFLPKIFSEDTVVAFDNENIFYRCRCSNEKILSILDQMKITPDAETKIKCEYCGKIYSDFVNSENLS